MPIPRRRAPRALLALAVAALSTLICVPAASGQTSQIELPSPATLAGWTGDILDVYGPHDPGLAYHWETRKLFFDLVDAALAVPEDPFQHPFANPFLGAYIAILHRNQLQRVIDKLDATPPADDVRLHKLYSSGWIVQSANSCFAIDVSVGVFHLNASGEPGYTQSQLGALADRLDAYFVTHGHADHFSVQLAFEMIVRGKPVFVTQQLRDLADSTGNPLAPGFVPVAHDAAFTFGDVTVHNFEGAQLIANAAVQATNNCYLFRVAGANGTGLVIGHFGDNNAPGLMEWCQSQTQNGWGIDVNLNLGALAPALISNFAPECRFHSHDLEFTHPWFAFNALNQTSTFTPNRIVLMWGESFDLALAPAN